MTYTNNQYIRLDKPIEEIAKIEIKTDKKNKLIEDIEIGDYVNVVIANGKRVEYDNIYGGVKILITDEEALKKNEYKIPEYIEKIIVYGYVYENNKREIEKIKKELKNGLKLINAIGGGNERLALKLLEREDVNVNQINKNGNTALILACYNEMKRVALELLEREEININHVDRYGDTALILACWNKMEKVALKLLERRDININHVGQYENTALIWACRSKMENVALKLLEREDINQVNINRNTALIMACWNKMETVALKLLEREDINVNQVNEDRKTALDYAKLYRMESVIKRINELNKK